MKRKLFCLLLFAEGAALILLNILTDAFPKIFTSLTAFPFEQIGAGLRALSLTGSIGNGAALALTAAISCTALLPLFGKNSLRKERTAENLVLCLLSITVFAALYISANPDAMRSILPQENDFYLPAMKGALGITVWSVLACEAVISALRLFKTSGTDKLFKYTKVLLYLLSIYFTAAAVSPVSSLLSEIKSAENALGVIIAIVSFTVAALPFAANITITFSALGLLDRLGGDSREETSGAAARLSKVCAACLITVTVSCAFFNLLQLAFAKSLTDFSVTAKIPVTSLVFALAVLLLSRLITEKNRLADENEQLTQANEQLAEENEAFI